VRIIGCDNDRDDDCRAKGFLIMLGPAILFTIGGATSITRSIIRKMQEGTGSLNVVIPAGQRCTRLGISFV
jgi:hypothetical protein